MTSVTSILAEKLRQAQKQAFVPLGAQAELPQQAAQQQQQAQQAQQQQAQPAQPGSPDPVAALQAMGSQAQQPASPAPAQAPTQPQAAEPTMATNPDMLRAIMREETERAQAKPKKVSMDERMTQLEGLVLRMLEYHGLVPQATGQEQPALAQSPTDPQAAKVASELQILEALVKEQFVSGMLELATKQADTDTLIGVSGSVDTDSTVDQYSAAQNVIEHFRSLAK